MNILTKIFSRAGNYLFPEYCALCKDSLLNSYEIKYGLCFKCRPLLSVVRGNKCNFCGKPLISELEVCLGCREGKSQSLDRLWVIFPYTGEYRRLLTEYKFEKKTSLANFFSDKILNLLEEESLLREAVIVPVPPRPGKIKKTVWDQVDFLVKNLNKLTEQKIYRCLKRRKSQVQKRLSRNQRMDNLTGRIYTYKNIPKTVLLIDDIITTGSTLNVCASVLKENGAEKVYGLCLFYD